MGGLRLWGRRYRVRLWLIFLLLAFAGCLSPGAPPAPLAEIPSTLLVPRDISIGVDEVQGSGSVSGLVFGSLAKAQGTVTGQDIAEAIEVAKSIFDETNIFLDNSLFVVSRREIPVEVSVFNFAYSIEIEGQSFEIKFDFGIFDLNGDGVPEPCSGCTCPTGCLPALSDCPSEAPVEQLLPICFRTWVNNERFMAGLFNKVPTLENPQSGQIRVIFPESGDQGGSNMGIIYDHQDPQNLLTDLSFFGKDHDVPGDEFFGSRHAVTTQEGPDAQAKKTPRLNADLFDSMNSRLRFQAQFFSSLDFIMLESIPEGSFEDVLGLVPITPPICAQISSADPVAQVLCDDLGLALTPGNFPPPAALADVVPPPFDQFPESPTFQE